MDVCSDLAPAFHGTGQGDFVGIFEIATHRNTMGNPGRADIGWLQEPGDVESSGLPFDGWIGCQDDFRYGFIGAQAGQEFPQADLVRPDILQGRNDPVQDVVQSFVLMDAFHGGYIARIFNDTDNGAVTTGRSTDITGILVGQVAADGTQPGGSPGVKNRLGERLHTVLWLGQQMESQALGRFAADTWQFAELRDQSGNRR